MDIDKFIQEKAPNDDIHDIAYARELRIAYDEFKELSLSRLNECRRTEGRRPDTYSSHEHTARMMVLFNLIDEKK